MTAPRLLCVGALTYDTILRLDVLPSGAGKFLPSEAVQIAAGMAASAAASASRQGGQVWLWASVGDDAVGRDVIGQMEAERVDCSLVRRVEGGRSAIATILVDAAGERMIVPFYDAITQADPDRLPPADFSRFDAVLVDVRWPGAAALALAKARECGIPAILDADVASRPVLDRLLPLASHVVASLPAARILCGPEVSAGSAVAILGERTGAFVAVTDGANGTAFRHPGGNDVRHLPSPRVEAVDTLAAGDVFHGTFALGLAEGWDEERAVAVASAAAALKCLRFGGRLGAPTRAETLAFMQGST
ncbi:MULTISPECIES: PfkB family carbohydrate kinase [unclassified Mesorhizobium]|uniref:PfkB family carbohydrate kinase n=1 Tax=unclassified Mesorhizobium TaxID=325217 RepID=UPI00333ACF03